jgi:hypothetical protein
MLYIDIIRFLSIVVLLLIVVIDKYPYIGLIKDASIQFILALFCITILLIIDNIAGFILILALLILYFKLFNKILIKNNSLYSGSSYENDKYNNIYESIYEKVNYTTEKNLVDAQNNIVDIENYNTEIKILDNDTGLYSTQGLDVGTVNGYSKYDLLIENNIIA